MVKVPSSFNFHPWRFLPWLHCFIDLGDEFFKTDTPHGYAKRFTWMRYLQAFVAKTQNSGYSTLIYDGFAGPGVYFNAWEEDIAKYGSPLIALRVSIQYFIKNGELSNIFTPSPPSEVLLNGVLNPQMASCSIQIYLVEANISNFNELVKNIPIIIHSYNIDYIKIEHSSDCVEIFCDDESFSIGCRVSHNEFKNVDPPDMVEDDRLVSFIDPFGYKDIPMSHVGKFVGSRKEIYLNFINRFFDVNEERMQQIFGMNIAAIESRLLNYKSDRLNNCVSLYKDILEENCTTDAFLLSFEMKNLSNARLYHMIFISCHEKGLEAMKEAMNRGSQEPESFSLSDFDILKGGQTINLKNGQDDDKVATVILERFKGQPSVSINTVRQFVIHDTIFVWRKGPLKILHTCNKITDVVNKDGYPPKRTGTFPDHTEWFLTFAADFDEVVQGIQKLRV